MVRRVWLSRFRTDLHILPTACEWSSRNVQPAPLSLVIRTLSDYAKSPSQIGFGHLPSLLPESFRKGPPMTDTHTQPAQTTLTTCPDCGHQVSTRADKCVHCGAPIKETPIVIEQSSKRWKAWQGIGILLLLSILPLMVVSPLLGFDSELFMELYGFAILLAAGVLCFVYGTVRRWWHHG